MLKNLFFITLEKALNKILSLDEESATRLKNLGDKTIHLEFTQPSLNCFLTLNHEGVKVADKSDQPIDMTLRGPVKAFIKLSLQEHKNLQASEVKITGDIALAEVLQKIFRQLDFDWEGGLANYTGDTAAYHIGKALRGGAAWLKQTHRNLQVTGKEYLQEEINVLPTRDEMQHFTSEVTKLRHDVERLEAKIN